jgi:hypothetical protein
MLKNNVDSKFNFIGTFEPNAPLVKVSEHQKATWLKALINIKL